MDLQPLKHEILNIDSENHYLVVFMASYVFGTDVGIPDIDDKAKVFGLIEARDTSDIGKIAHQDTIYSIETLYLE